jgi:hypothetical protein
MMGASRRKEKEKHRRRRMEYGQQKTRDEHWEIHLSEDLGLKVGNDYNTVKVQPRVINSILLHRLRTNDGVMDEGLFVSKSDVGHAPFRQYRFKENEMSTKPDKGFIPCEKIQKVCEFSSKTSWRGAARTKLVQSPVEFVAGALKMEKAGCEDMIPVALGEPCYAG